MSTIPRRHFGWWLAALVAGSGLLWSAPPDEKPERYGDTPAELVPYRSSGAPYSTFFVDPPQFRGPGRDEPEPANVRQVEIGVLRPLSGPDVALGESLQRGADLALAEANAAGGYRGRAPFVAVTRDESQAWGAAANAVVELAFERRVWGIVGAFEDSASHVMSRVLLKAEVPVVNTAGTDPTLTEHRIPWMVRVRPDDRRNGYRLAEKIFRTDGRQRVAVFRANDRYARMGIGELTDAARRLHRPILLEVRFQNHGTEWNGQIQRLRQLRPDAIVVWGRAEPTGRVVAALRAAGLEQPIYGPDRLVSEAFLAAAGAAAEGAVLVTPFDPARDDPAWTAFRERFAAAYGSPPDAVAAYAYDGTRLLLRAIEEVGLNRPRIADWLFGQPRIEGVTGTIRFDATQNNITPVTLCRVENGAFHIDSP